MASPPVATNMDVSGGGSTSSGGGFDFASMVPTILEKIIAGMEAALIIVAGLFAIRYIRGKLRKLETQHEQQRTAINLFEKLTSGIIIVLIITMALKVVGIDMTLLVSVAILGLSYGLQDIIKNYVAGILILFKAPFRIGDVVKIRDFTGKVAKIDFQSTTLETFDNRHITIYNSDVMTQSIINFSNNTMRRLDFDVTIGYGSDTPTALKIFNKILGSNEKILKSPRFSIVFKKFSELGPVFTLKFWVTCPCNILKIRTIIAAQIAQAFDEEKIMSPYTKDVQTETEPDFLKITDERKKRIQAFYGSPFLAESAASEAQPTVVSQPVIDPATGQPVLDAATGQPLMQTVTITEPLADDDEPEA